MRSVKSDPRYASGQAEPDADSAGGTDASPAPLAFPRFAITPRDGIAGSRHVPCAWGVFCLPTGEASEESLRLVLGMAASQLQSFGRGVVVAFGGRAATTGPVQPRNGADEHSDGLGVRSLSEISV